MTAAEERYERYFSIHNPGSLVVENSMRSPYFGKSLVFTIFLTMSGQTVAGPSVEESLSGIAPGYRPIFTQVSLWGDTGDLLSGRNAEQP